ncbi:YhcH/YjgK/YiaL family protein [Enterorhabdus sp. P55]|uniref:YhcH/YjgK/YiaL family protein n=1 Tax=Enterorhabdus sp. P55 TaxID=2304571 RepID=UPI00136B6D51|nr:YhcH/YjgK/YiaL family protein [Enterorhabdus sp. P55]NBI32572.1 DUF386 family protein [Enterorhabdus sp. P55]
MTPHIKYFVTDIDGTLTDGKVYMGPSGEAMKAFSIKDGYALSFLLKEADIEPVVITGRTSAIVEGRCRELGIASVSQGVTDKLPKLVEVVGEDCLGECAYFGDDVLDLACMAAVSQAGGIVGCPADAVREVRAAADYVCNQDAGDGAGREFIEWLLAPRVDENEVRSRIRQAVEHMEQMLASNPEDGVYETNDWLTVTVKRVSTDYAANRKLESHRKHVDIQWIIEGEEAIDIASVSSLSLETPYDPKEDVAFWERKASMTRVVLREGSYVVLYPKDAHMPCIAVSEPAAIRVAIGKVRVG